MHAAALLSSEFSDRGLLFGGRETRLLAFASELTTAEDADAVRVTLRRYMGQTGGFADKREPGSSFTRLNAYIGAGVGADMFSNSSGSEIRRSSHVAVRLPVGIERGRGNGHSNSIFLQLLNLGAVATARTGLQHGEESASLSIESMIVPGLFYVRGFNSKPFAAGVGLSVAPRAMRVDTTMRDVFRFGGFIAFDVPIFP